MPTSDAIIGFDLQSIQEVEEIARKKKFRDS